MLVDDDVCVKHTIWIILIRLRITTHAGSIPDQLRSSELIKIASLYILGGTLVGAFPQPHHWYWLTISSLLQSIPERLDFSQ